MDLKYGRFAVMEDKANLVLSYLPKDSTAQNKIPATLEALQDRWDILLSIVEAQSQRVSQ